MCNGVGVGAEVHVRRVAKKVGDARRIHVCVLLNLPHEVRLVVETYMYIYICIHTDTDTDTDTHIDLYT